MASKRDSIESGRGHVTLGIDQTPLQNGLDAARKSVQAWGKSIMATGAAVSAAGAAIIAPFLNGLSIFSDWGREMTVTMRETGIGFENLDMIMDGMRVTGEEVTGMAQAMSRQLTAAFTEPAGEASQALQSMGLSVEQLASMSQSERILTLADAISQVSDESVRMARMRQFFRTQSANVTGGRAGIESRAARADEIEGVQTPEMLAAAQRYNDAMREMKLAASGLWMSIGAAAAPAMTEFFKLVMEVVVAVRKWADENRNLLNAIFRIADKMVLFGGIIVGVGAAVHALGYAFVAFKYITYASSIATIAKAIALGIAKGAVIAYTAVVAACSFVVGLFTGSTWAAVGALAALAIGIGAIALVAMAVPSILESWTAIFNTLAPTIRTAFAGITDAISAGEWALAVDIAWAAILLTSVQGINWIKQAWLAFKFVFMDIWDSMTTWVYHAMTDFTAAAIEQFYSILEAVTEVYHSIVGVIARELVSIAGLFAENINRIINLIPEVIRTTIGVTPVAFDAAGLQATMQTDSERERRARVAQRERDANDRRAFFDADATNQNIDNVAAAARQARIEEWATEIGRAGQEEGFLQNNLLGLVAEAARRAAQVASTRQEDRRGDPQVQRRNESVMGAFNAAAIAGFLGSSAGSSETRAEREARVARETLQALLRLQEQRRGVVMA